MQPWIEEAHQLLQSCGFIPAGLTGGGMMPIGLRAVHSATRQEFEWTEDQWTALKPTFSRAAGATECSDELLLCEALTAVELQAAQAQALAAKLRQRLT